jgi:hypothetical protein
MPVSPGARLGFYEIVSTGRREVYVQSFPEGRILVTTNWTRTLLR